MKNNTTDHSRQKTLGCATCPNLPQCGQLRSWVDCCNCFYADFTPGIGYWCKKYGGYDPREGCSMGIER